jgi:hypothetical protein
MTHRTGTIPHFRFWPTSSAVSLNEDPAGKHGSKRGEWNQGVMILNGRLPGDMVGSMTYTQHGNFSLNRSSLIDYLSVLLLWPLMFPVVIFTIHILISLTSIVSSHSSRGRMF